MGIETGRRWMVVLTLAGVAGCGGESGAPGDGEADGSSSSFGATGVDDGSTGGQGTAGDASSEASVSTTGGDGGDDGGDVGSTGAEVPAECGDGIDNDGDGFIDFAGDHGCYGPGDRTEASGSREDEDGFTTYELPADAVVVYVSNEGSDDADGATPDTAVATLQRAAELVRDGAHDFILLRRGDTWRDVQLGRFLSGADAEHPLVISSYGPELVRPRLEIPGPFIDHNGQSRSNVALLGLHFASVHGDPADPSFDGAPGAALRWVGGGSGLLVEGCYFEYGEGVVQSFGEGHYDGVQFRRNVFDRAYHADTCLPGNPNGSNEHRPSGLYASHADNLLIEENVFDHNGWNPDGDPTACATIYNHNMYLNGHDMVIRGNLLARASSIHIKLRSDSTEDMSNLLIEDNFMIEGEVGISLGGNTDAPHRFVNSVVRDNVLTDIGRSQPTGRGLAWAIGMIDNDGARIEGNLILNHRAAGVGNAFGVRVRGASSRNYVIEDNVFWRLQNRALLLEGEGGHEAIRVAFNEFADPTMQGALVHHTGPLAAFEFEGNRYSTTADASSWFRVDGQDVDLDGWRSATGEDAVAFEPGYPEPDRDLESYATSIAAGDDLPAFLEHARGQSRFAWRDELTATAINDYIREGFGR
ncbi:MAG: right-handed parallel beta-helix repeat-containing protein [Myxococcota bacterium]